MANQKFTQLPAVVNATLDDIIAAVQAGVSVQETLGQVFTLMLANTILSGAGNPNGSVGGSTYQLYWDTTNHVLYVCTTSGVAGVAVWTLAGSLAIPVPVASGGTGATTLTNHGILIGHGTSAVSASAALTNGQLLIGRTGLDPIAANLTAGPGVSIANASGSITISGTGSGIGWTEVTGVAQAMVADNGYVANNAGLVTLTLPATAAFGQAITVMGKGAGGWRIAQNAGQSIRIGTSVSTTGAGGRIESTNAFDSIELICTTANTVFTCMGGPQGNITVV